MIRPEREDHRQRQGRRDSADVVKRIRDVDTRAVAEELLVCGGIRHRSGSDVKQALTAVRKVLIEENPKLVEDDLVRDQGPQLLLPIQYLSPSV